ncbi:hypothetical protein QAD02_011942 [Eretmocerus hayati]|uniref:Uncharacterized protein n=1 Tax=Eretmocerus hayati TaxID=131215 RepID=A0ACC2NZC2_9HYME|nr:hypothetical protein QAD02_011942 [Eretmocerus hayati]
MYDYTPTAVVDDLEVKDTTAEFVGYVDYVDGIRAIPEHGNLQRIVLNNTKGLRIMVTCWNNNIPAMMVVAEIGNVLEISGLLVKEDSSMKNNLGSTTKFFETQAITTYNLLGQLHEIPVDAGICKVDFETAPHTQGIICIEGVVKNAPRLQTSDIVGNKVVGGITNGMKVLEINLPADQKVDHIMKGETIKVIGAMIKKSYGLHVIKVSGASDIIRMPGVLITDLEYFLNANSQV